MKIINTWLEKTVAELSLTKILIIAAVVRLIAAFFSAGYGMHDDHFNVIEVAQSWADGKNVGYWLPDVPSGVSPDVMHSLFYPGIHFILFSLLNGLGINDPQTKMILIRILHAFYSLLTVYFSYRITEKLSNTSAAKWCALFISLLWFMPNLSVRNLIEMVCIPPLLAGTYLLIKNKDERNLRRYLAAGFVIGFAFSIRFQTALFIGGVGLVLLLQKEWRGFLFYSTGVIVNIFLFQCITDIVLWGYPLAEFLGYIHYNIQHKGDFITGYWFNYLLLITGLVLPPFSILFWFGYFKNTRERLLLFLPSFIFLVFHSCFVNQQERFILPFIPFFIILGFVGWEIPATRFVYSPKWKNTFRRVALTVIFLNMILLGVVSVASTKTSRMNAMYYLYQKGDVRAFVVEASYSDGFQYFPRFYLGKWFDEYLVKKTWSAEQIKNNILPESIPPNYVIFLSEENLPSRIDNFKKAYPHIEHVVTIQPGFIDRLFHKLNPVNKNEPCIIYKINA